MKTTAIDTARANKQKKAVDDLKARPKPDKETMATLSDHLALIDEILGLG